MTDRPAAFQAALAQAFEQGRAFEAGLVALLTYPDLLAERYDSRHWGTKDDHGAEEETLSGIISAIYAVLFVTHRLGPVTSSAARRFTTEALAIAAARASHASTVGSPPA